MINFVCVGRGIEILFDQSKQSDYYGPERWVIDALQFVQQIQGGLSIKGL